MAAGTRKSRGSWRTKANGDRRLRRLQLECLEERATPAGLVAAYSFDEGGGGIVGDSSGNNNAGTTGTASWTTNGKFGGALVFNGADSQVTVNDANSLDLTAGMTLEAWVNPTDVSNAWRDVIYKGPNDIYFLEGTSSFGPPATGGTFLDPPLVGASMLATNTWAHLASTFDGSQLKLYVNGVLVASRSNSNPIHTSSGDVTIGGDALYGQHWSGRIDEVRVYSQALTVEEIQLDMATPVGNPAPDTVFPTIALTNPMAGTVISQVGILSADAADDRGVAGVEFWVDGAMVGVDGAEPYSINWNTTGLANGPHEVLAVARDNSGNATATAPIQVETLNPAFVNEIVVPGIFDATTIAFLPDGRMLVGELTNKILMVQPGANEPDPQPLVDLDYSYQFGEQGLMDVAIDPEFETNGYIYAFYTKGFVDQQNYDRLSRFTMNGDSILPGSELALWQDDVPAGAEHHGGGIAFAPDESIYFTTGEHFDPPTSQDLGSYRGKVLRIERDGSIPQDNPFVDGPGPNKDEIWAYGLRNPFRISCDPVTGKIYVADVGGNDPNTAQEEINLLVKGANYGWPLGEGDSGIAGTTAPLYSYPHLGRDASITGGFVYRGSQFPSEYYGSYFFGDYVQNTIRRLTFDDQGNLKDAINFMPADGSLDQTLPGDVVKLIEGPDGSIYYIDLGFNDSHVPNDAAIRRIRYVVDNLPPVAVATADVLEGPSPLVVNFSSQGSLDPEGNVVSYLWKFGDGQTSTAANPTHTYPVPGPYTATLTVSDGLTSTLSSNINIAVGHRPVATITSPTDGSLFRANDAIVYTGTADDAEDGPLDASAYSWSIRFRHDSHIHPAGGPFTGTTSGTLPIPASGHDFEGATRYEIVLTVTDSSGLTDTASVTVFPDKVHLTFDTIPSGLTIDIDGISKQTPFALDDLIGFEHTISAADQLFGGANYVFTGWSDGGAQSHPIVVPTASANYVAAFQIPDSVPPTAPTQLAAVTDGSQVRLTWQPASDNVGVTEYRIERRGPGDADFAPIGVSVTNEFFDTPEGGKRFSYRVLAVDGAGNVGPASTEAAAGVDPQGMADVTVPLGNVLTTPPSGWLAVNDAIATADELDFFHFVLSSPVGIFFDVDSRDTQLSDTLDSILDVYTPDWELVPGGTNDDGYDFEGFNAPLGSGASSAVSPDSSLYLDLPAGEYAVRVSAGQGTTGAYVLRILADPNYSASVPAFASLSGASDTLYLDFDGHSASDGWGTYTALPFDFNGNTSVFTPAERLAMRNTWRVTAEDYSPFAINVTTTQPASFADGVAYRQVLTSSSASIIGESASTLGASFTGSYTTGGASFKVGFTFASSFSSYNGGISGRIMATALEEGNTSSHEPGHAFGLRHFLDGAQSSAIMFSPDTGLNRESWQTGINSTGATQADMSVLASGTNTFGFRADDFGNSRQQATALTLIAGVANTAGVIGQTTDVDYFSFFGGGDAIVRVDVDDYLNNLDATVRLFDSNGMLLGSSDPSQSFDAILTTSLPQATYFIEVGSNGEYGEAGQYKLQLQLVPDTQAPTAPTNVTAAPQSSNRIDLAWTAATDNTGVAGYRVERKDPGAADFVEIASLASTSFSDTPLPPNTSFEYRVRAADASGNLGPYSNATSATTLGLVVTNTLDSGPGSLRQALLEANSSGHTSETIDFNLPGPGPHTIAPATDLPTSTIGVIYRIPANTIVQIGTSGSRSISQSGGLTKTGAGTLELGGPQFHAAGANVTVAEGTLVLASDAGADIVVAPGGVLQMEATQNLRALAIQMNGAAKITPGGGRVLRTNNLSMDPAGRLDLADNAMIVQSSLSTRDAVLAQLTSLILSGSANLTWTGPGIASSTAAADPRLITAVGIMLNDDGSGGPFRTIFGGQSVDRGSILIKYAYYGDADLSGIVDGTDYALIDNGFNASLHGWFNGDFDVSGTVDGTDYALIDNAFNQQSGPLGSVVPALAAAPPPDVSSPTDMLDGQAASNRRADASVAFIDPLDLIDLFAPAKAKRGTRRRS